MQTTNDAQGQWLDNFMADSPGTQGAGEQRLINVAAIRGILFRQRWLIALILLAAIVAGVVMTVLATPMYEARASVRVEPYGANIVEGQDIDQGVAATQVFDMMATQREVITSRNMARIVAADLELGKRDDFLGPEVDQNRPANISDAEWRETRQRMAEGILHGGVSAETPTEGFIIDVIYRSPNPAIAAEMANAYATAFAELESRESRASSQYAQEYLLEQIGVTRERLQAAEQAANAYARANQIIVQPVASEESDSAGTLTTTYLASINERASTARANRIQAEQRWRAVQGLPASQLAEYQSNTLLQGLLGQRTTKQIELAELRQRYSDDFPQVVNLQSQIATIETQIDRTSSDIKSVVRNDFLVARNQEQALMAELASATGDTLTEQDRRVEFGVRDREAQALRDQLAALLTRYNQVATATDVDSGRINLLDTAVVPRSPYEPNLIRNLTLALVFGIALAAIAAVLRETIDDRIRSLDDIEQRIGIPLLGHTPYVAAGDLDSEISNRFGSLMEAYSSIRATIDFSVPRDRRIIQFTSSQPSEGKSTTAIALAELFASLGRKTLLVDADLRRPAVASMLHLGKAKAGIVEVLLGEAAMADAIIKGNSENLDVLTVSQIPSNPTEVIASGQFKDFITTVRNQYDLVIFDSSPVLGLADAPMLANLVDGTIFVMEANTVHFGQVKSSIQRLRSSGGKIIGGVLTKYRALQAGDGYSYQYSYYKYGDSPSGK